MGLEDSERAEAYEIAGKFWEYLGSQKWDQARDLLADNFECFWPQSRETMDRTGFINVNKNYPGSHQIESEHMSFEYDRWDHSSSVVTRTYIKSKMPEGKSVELYAISFFKIEHDEDGEKKISELIEYWAETYPAPKWRSQWVKVCDGKIM